MNIYFRIGKENNLQLGKVNTMQEAFIKIKEHQKTMFLSSTELIMNVEADKVYLTNKVQPEIKYIIEK